MSDGHRVIVVGSGPSGATAALGLLERGIPVTMLESGQVYPGGLIIRAFGRNLYRRWGRIQEGYPFLTSGDPDTRWYNSLVPGGLSNQWTGVVPRFAPEDFWEGEVLHERYRWPVSYSELAPYYSYAERLLGVVGERRAIPQLPSPEALVHERHLPHAWQTVARSAELNGVGLVYAPLADGPSWMVRRTGTAFNSFDRIVSRLARFPDFELRLGAHTQRLTWNASLGRVDGVEYVDRATGVSSHLAASAVVLAAGALASPKLLLQSTSQDFPNGLGNARGLLGRFVHDHPKDWSVLQLDRPLPRLDQPLYLSRGAYTSAWPLMGASMTVSPLAKWDRVLSCVGATTNRFGLVTFATMLPEEHNHLSLHPQKRDQFGMPILDIHMRFGSAVAEVINLTKARLVGILKQAGFQARLEVSDERPAPGLSAHYGGGVRMHASRHYGVLDGWNRMHDATNVAVVDASSFTTGVEKNPTLTVMALAARAAERLADELQSDAVDQRQRWASAEPSLR